MGVNHSTFGTFCAICYTQLTQETAAADTEGNTWDVCKGECARQAGLEEHTPMHQQDDTVCQDCGHNNPPWYAPDHIWNTTMAPTNTNTNTTDDPGGMVCPSCFIDRAHTKGTDPIAWVLLPEAKCTDCQRPYWQINTATQLCNHCILKHAHK